MYSPRRIAQMAAFFAHKQGGKINVLKLSKLLYLSDRESMRQFGLPISYDNMVSMPKGPVLSQSLNLINGDVDAASAAVWDEWMDDRENHDVEVKRTFERGDLDQLSNVDISVLEKIWQDFGGMDRYVLRDWTHKNCSEWEDPKGSSYPIKDVTVLKALGREEKEAESLAKTIGLERELDALFSRL